MATRDVAQLILEVDARIATAQRSVNQLAKAVQKDAEGMTGALGSVEKANARLGRALNDNGRIRAGFTQLSFQIGDVSQQMALGVSASRIFAQQSGQVIQALQVMGGEGNKFLKFMGGSWGIAISTAAVILGPLISKLFDTGDSVDDLVGKMREQAKQAEANDKAQEAWKQSLDGAEQAIRDVNKALDELEGKAKSTAQRELEAAERALAVAEAHRAAAAAAIERARAEYELQKSMASSPSQRGELAALGLPEKLGAIDSAESQLSRVDSDISKGRAAVERAQSFVTVEKASASATEKINARYDQLIEQARKRALAEHKVGDELTRQVEQLNKQREAALKAAEPSKSGDDRQSGRQVDFAQAIAIAKAGGLQVNSGYRSPAEQARLYNDPAVNRPGNPVAPPGASAHNGANGKWAIDIQITDGVTPGKIRKVFADQGVSLTKVLKEKGHFHIEGSRSEAARAENSAESEAEKAARQQNAFEEQRDRLNQQLIGAQGSLVQGTEAQAKAAQQQVFAEEKRANTAIHNDLEEGRYGEATSKVAQARAAELLALNHSVAVEKLKAIELQRQIQQIRDADEAQQRLFEYKIDDLRFADDMAKTQAEHRRLQLQILDIVYQEKQAHLENLKAIALKSGDTKQASDLQAQIDRLPAEKEQDRQRTLRGTMSPLEAWADQVPKTAAEINEALQSIEARGLDSLANALTDVITGTKSLGDAFRDVARSIIADIVQMTIRMLIFRAISAAFGGGGTTMDASFVGGLAKAGAAAGNPLGSAKGNVFYQGSIVPHRLGGIVSQPSFFPMAGGKMGSMAEDGPEAIMPLARDPMGRLGVRAAAAARAGGGPIELIIHSAPSDDAWVRIDHISTTRAGQAAKLSINHTNKTLSDIAKPKLMGGR